MIGERRHPLTVEIVLQVPAAAMHRPQLMPHRRTLRGVLVDDEVIEESAANPFAPLQLRVAKRWTEQIAAGDADANRPAERRAQLRQQRGDEVAEQIAPRLTIELSCNRGLLHSRHPPTATPRAPEGRVR